MNSRALAWDQMTEDKTLSKARWITPAIREALDRDGYAVVPGVLDSDSCDYVVDDIFNWLEGAGTGIDRADPATMRGAAWPSTVHNMIHYHHVGHLPGVWSTRLASHEIFAELHGTPDLITSFDGINVTRPPEICGTQFAPEEKLPFGSIETKLNRHWFHIDHNLRDTSERDCIQGFVNLEETGPDDAALVVLPGAHHLLDQVPDLKSTGSREYTKITDDMVSWLAAKTKRPAVRVVAPRGSLVLWSSRLPHCGIGPRRGRAEVRWRYVVYVCQTPRAWATADTLARRCKAFEEQRMTTHSPHNLQLVPLKGQWSDSTNVSFTDRQPEIELTDELKRLIGY